MQAAVISAMINYDDVYHGVREGYRRTNTSPWQAILMKSLDYGDIYERLDSILGLSVSSFYHEKRTSDGKLEFKVWGFGCGYP